MEIQSQGGTSSRLSAKQSVNALIIKELKWHGRKSRQLKENHFSLHVIFNTYNSQWPANNTDNISTSITVRL